MGKRGKYKITKIPIIGCVKDGKRIPEYSAWRSMRQRCYNKSHYAYNDYGGRGITVCDSWNESFLNFKRDMGDRPSKKHTLDRYPNNDGNYEPGNCRWATMKEQCQNRRNSVWIEHDGKKMILQQWADYFGVDSGNLGVMLKKRTFSEIVEHYQTGGRGVNITHMGKTRKISEWVKYLTIGNRHLRNLLKIKPFSEIYKKHKK